ncbi:MAG: hypothetical protein WBB34_22935 [Xanthobacteraceae bacterium]
MKITLAIRSPILSLVLALGGVAASFGVAAPAVAGDYGQVEYSCYQCLRDAIYADITLIDRLEADPYVDDGIKGPQISAARDEINRLRKILGPVVDQGALPCCYTRPPIYVR